MLTSTEVLALTRKYTDESVIGGGAIKGKNCTIESKTPISNGTRLTFKWTLDDGTELTDYIDVLNGADGSAGATGEKGDTGVGIQSTHVDLENHLIITYTDGTVKDAGEIISASGGTTNYEALNNKPTVNGTTLEGAKTLSDLGIVTPKVQGELLTFS